ncbi:hypothetical protein HYU06_05760 [Candidatus Woesearchaeota archaeon]|nr:hypothetical protein [Candidatus Woesearchaeota archaeon]
MKNKARNYAIKYFVYIFLSAILIGLLLVLSSCNGNDSGEEKETCKKASDCRYPGKDKKAFTAKCEDKECVYAPKPGVCGNGKCDKEEGETLCSCPKDCPDKERKLTKCDGKVSNSEYLEYKCDKKQQCVVEITGQKQVPPKSENLEFKQRNIVQAKVLLTYVYPEPFNIDSDVLSLKLKLDEKLEADEVTLKRIQLIRHTGQKVRGRWDEKDQEIQLIDKLDINRVLWDPQIEVEQSLPIEADVNQSQRTTLTLKLFFTYKVKDAKGSVPYDETKTFDIENFILAKSTATAECTPAKCDDKNPCTEDRCVSNKGYCENIVKPGKCKGNFRCDDDQGENKCNAPEDCGYCKGKAGDYTEYKCNDNNKECIIVLGKDVKIDEKVLTNEQKLPGSSPDIRFKIIKTFNSPFKAKASGDMFTLTMQVLDKKATTRNFKVNTIELVDGTSLLGTTQVSQTFNNIGDKFDFKIPFTKNLVTIEEKRTKLKLKVTFSYEGVDRQDKPLVHTNEILEEELGEVLLVNAG